MMEYPLIIEQDKGNQSFILHQDIAYVLYWHVRDMSHYFILTVVTITIAVVSYRNVEGFIYLPIPLIFLNVP